MLLALIDVLLILLNVLWWIIVIQAILSLLVAFNVINTHNDVMRSVYNALDRITRPLRSVPEDPARFRRHRFQPVRGSDPDHDRQPPAHRALPGCRPGTVMTAVSIDGRAFALRLRERVAAAIPGVRRSRRPPAGPCRRPRRRGSGQPGLCAIQVEGADRGRDGQLRASPSGHDRPERARRAGRAAQSRRGRRRHPRPVAAPGRDRRQGGHRGDRSRQGRRRISPPSMPAGLRSARTGWCHAPRSAA